MKSWESKGLPISSCRFPSTQPGLAWQPGLALRNRAGLFPEGGGSCRHGGGAIKVGGLEAQKEAEKGNFQGKEGLVGKGKI